MDDNNVIFSSHGPFPFPPLFSPNHFDISNPNLDDVVVMSLDDSFSTLNANLPNAPSVKKKNYDTNRKFKESWPVKLPWTRFCLGSNRSLHSIKCKIYSKVERKDKILATKWDYFCKHVGWQKVLNNIGINVKKGEWYYSKYCKHTKKPYIVYFLYSINYRCLNWKWGSKK